MRHITLAVLRVQVSLKDWTSATYSMFYQITSSLNYIMMSFGISDVGWTGDRNNLDRGIRCKINENSRN